EDKRWPETSTKLIVPLYRIIIVVVVINWKGDSRQRAHSCPVLDHPRILFANLPSSSSSPSLDMAIFIVPCLVPCARESTQLCVVRPAFIIAILTRSRPF